MKIEQIWPEWKVEKAIGQGSYGTVYKCVCNENGTEKYSAIKVISVPQNDAEYGVSTSDGLTNAKEDYKEIVDEFAKEIKILESLKGNKNIVSIEDSKVIEKEDGIGWQIFIRMELLTDFNTYTSQKKLEREDIFKLGTDLCEALKVCASQKIIHRDIKPENIFVDSEGNFKLGDFGVAKQLEKTEASLSRKGTYNYMAPEVFNSKKYDSRADIYSLGIVMYKLFNNNRLPFIDPTKQIVKYSEREEAFEKRIRGEKIPAINNVDENTTQVIYNVGSASSPTAWKMGWVKTTDYNKLAAKPETTTTSTSNSAVQKKLDAVIAQYPNGTRFTGSFDGATQCYGFGKKVIYEVFGKYSSSRYRSWTYAGVSTSGMNVVGSTTSYHGHLKKE